MISLMLTMKRTIIVFLCLNIYWFAQTLKLYPSALETSYTKMALSVESVQSACAPHVDLYCSLSQLTPEFSSNFDSQSIAGLEEKYSSSRRLTGSFLRHKHTISSSKLHIFGEHVDQCLENIWRKKLIPSENLIPSCNESLTLLDERIETYNFILSWKRIFLPLVSFHFFLWIVLWKKTTSEPYL